MKKLAALLAAGVMVFAMGLTALAAASVTSEDAKVLVDGQEVTVSIVSGLPADKIDSALEYLNTVVQDPNATFVGYCDITAEIPAGKSIQIPIKADVKAGESIYLLHQLSDGTWEIIVPDSVVDGVITATFRSLSPVVIVKGEIPASARTTTSTGTKSPKTGEAAIPVAMVMVLCAAGAMVAGKKFAVR